MNLRMDVMIEVKAVILLENANQGASKGGKTSIYKAVEKVVRRVVTWGAVNDVINTKDNNVSKSRDFRKRFTSSFILNPSFTVLFTRLVSRHAHIDVADAVKSYE